MKTELAPFADCFRWILLPLALFIFGRFVSARTVPHWSRSVLVATLAVGTLTMLLSVRTHLKMETIAKIHAQNAHHVALR